MTEPLDLTDIEARDAGTITEAWGGQAAHDRRALLAEVHRLRAALGQRPNASQRSQEARQTPQKVGDVTTDPTPPSAPLQAPYGQPQQHGVIHPPTEPTNPTCGTCGETLHWADVKGMMRWTHVPAKVHIHQPRPFWPALEQQARNQEADQ